MENEIKVRKKDSAQLAWDSKPRRAPNPKDIEFQTAEVVIPNAHRDVEQLPLLLRDGNVTEPEIDKTKMNRLIWGDNLLAMQALLAQGYEGKINLIYIDPPFDSKADYSHKMTITPTPLVGEGKGKGFEFTKEPSVIERLAYKDTWTGGTDSYLDMLYPRLQLMKRLLAEDGSIYVHLDYNANSYVRILLDEIFGKDCFQNEIIWHYIIGASGTARWGRKYQSILFYSKSSNHYFDLDSVRVPYNPETIARAKRGDPRYSIDPEELEKKGKNPGDVWIDITPIQGNAIESVDYDTQKPIALLRRIIKASSKIGDIVADLFGGSGTACFVAEELGRRWIMCELGKVGIQVTRSRLVEQEAKPFLIENIGNYQREMIYLTGGRIWEMQQLILKLYGATPRDKSSGLGIRKVDSHEELVYVGYPDRPITAKKAEELAVQAQKLDGRGYKHLVILGWDYEYNYKESLDSRLKSAKSKIKVEIIGKDIPPDIYDYLKKAKTEEDIEALSNKIKFYERPYLKLAKTKIEELDGGKIKIIVGINKYVLMDVPVSQEGKQGKNDYEALMKLAKNNFQVLIDYWAIDWDYDGTTFKSKWQAFRGNGRKAQTVPIEAIETLDYKRKRTIAVRVVDIFGNDAGAVVEV